MANKWPNNCYQIETITTQLFKSKDFSEDCLYLNIWSPGIRPEPEVGLKPVIVYIHIGAYYMDSSSNSIYDGKVLSSLGDVLVVTLNYRYVLNRYSSVNQIF